MTHPYFQKIAELEAASIPTVSVTMVDATGSTPQDQGSKMLVTHDGLVHGTVGGGRIENQAIETALDMLSGQNPNWQTHFVEWNLQRDVGMTCGGVVKLFFETLNFLPWTITIFGAGHVANVLIPVLLNLDCQIICLDTRQAWLDKLPISPRLTKIHSDDLPQEVENISPQAFVLLMTKGHATDRPILQKFLERGNQSFIGVIGSKSKASILRKELLENGMDKETAQQFTCPLGLRLGSNHPYEIAISMSAQLIELRDQIFVPGSSSKPEKTKAIS